MRERFSGKIGKISRIGVPARDGAFAGIGWPSVRKSVSTPRRGVV